MKLPSILALLSVASAIVVAHWLHKRLERVEIVSGSWQVQEPGYVLEFDHLADDAFERAFAEWVRQHRDGDAA